MSFGSPRGRSASDGPADRCAPHNPARAAAPRPPARRPRRLRHCRHTPFVRPCHGVPVRARRRCADSAPTDLCVSPGSACDVVQLAPRRGDELVSAVAHRGQLAPAVVIARIPRLAEGQQVQRSPRPSGIRLTPCTAAGACSADEIENRRHHVDDAHLVGDRREPARRARRRSAAYASPLRRRRIRAAVRRVRPATRRDRRRRRRRCGRSRRCVRGDSISLPDLRVRSRHLAVVRPLHRRRKARSIRLGRRRTGCADRRGAPRRRTAASRFSPSHASAWSTTSLPGRCAASSPAAISNLRQVEIVEVAIEALRDAPALVEHERADEPAGAVAARAGAPRPACRARRRHRSSPLSRTP